MKPLRDIIEVTVETVNTDDTFITNDKSQIYVAKAIGKDVKEVKPGDILKIVPNTVVGDDVVFVSEDNVLAIIRGNE